MTLRFADVRVLAFDLDGTLVDSARGIVESVNAVLIERGVPPAKYDEAAALIGLPLDTFWQHFSPLSADQWLALTTRYREIYHDTAIPASTLFAGVGDTIKRLHQTGYTLTIASSKITPVSKLVLEQVGLLEYFSLLVGNDSVEQPKPHPAMLHYTLHHCNATADQLLMIGDTTHDITLGQRAGVQTVAVTTGTHDAATLAAAAPTIVIQQLSELLAVLDVLA